MWTPDLSPASSPPLLKKPPSPSPDEGLLPFELWACPWPLLRDTSPHPTSLHLPPLHPTSPTWGHTSFPKETILSSISPPTFCCISHLPSLEKALHTWVSASSPPLPPRLCCLASTLTSRGGMSHQGQPCCQIQWRLLTFPLLFPEASLCLLGCSDLAWPGLPTAPAPSRPAFSELGPRTSLFHFLPSHLCAALMILSTLKGPEFPPQPRRDLCKSHSQQTKESQY